MPLTTGMAICPIPGASGAHSIGAASYDLAILLLQVAGAWACPLAGMEPERHHPVNAEPLRGGALRQH